MTTFTWSTGAVGDWNTAGNWAPASVPGAGDTAVVTAGSAELLSGVDPASDLTILLGAPTVAGPAGGVDSYLYTLNNTVGPGVTVADVTGGNEGVWAAAGITQFTGVIDVFGAGALMVLGVDEPNPTGIKEGPLDGASTNAVSDPANIGQFQNDGTISVSGGAGLLITPLNTLDNGAVSVLVGTIDLNDGELVSSFVSLGPPEGGIGASGTINMANGSTAAMNEATNIDANFQDGTGNRLIFTSTEQSVEITGFQPGDTIAQAPQVFFGVTTDFGNEGLNYNTATHVLEVTTGTDGTPFLNYTIEGDYTTNDFQAANNPTNGALDITFACFVAGTRIATERGEVAVEALAVGDMVATARTPGAPCREVRWIGRRHIDLRRHPDPAAARPIRIRAGAFEGALPRRDLWLSPDHALFLGGVLVPVRYLVNGATIARDDTVDAVTYHHVELASHDVLLAEGLPAESYLDTGNRHQFSNGGTFAALHADFSGRTRTWEEDACAPLRGEGPVVTAARYRLLARALALGWTLAPGQEMWLDVAGARINPVSLRAGALRFVLPAEARDIRLCSRAGVPAQVDPTSGDWRTLGAMVERIVLRRDRRRCEVLPEDERLADGFYAPERDGVRRWRWTDGSAALPDSLIPPGTGALTVTVKLAGLHPWWSEPAPAAQVARRAG